MTSDFELLRILNGQGIPFVIIGGHAVNYHGYGRLTEDTDVVWLRNNQSELALLQALAELDARRIGKDVDPATGIERTYPVTLPFIQATHLMMLWTRCGFLDLFDYIPGLPHEDVRQLFSSSVEADRFRYASLEWLKKMKKASGRTKDLLDLENLPSDG